MADESRGSIRVTGSGYRMVGGSDRRSAGASSAGGDPAIVFGLKAAGFQIGATLVEEPAAPRRGMGAVTIEIPVAPGEASALLLEDANGSFGWQYPDAGQNNPSRRSKAVSDLYTLPEAPDAENAPVARRTALIDWAIETVTKPIRIYAVRFLARKSISAAVAHIEAAVVPGPVLIEPGADAASWHAVDIARIAEKLAALRRRKSLRILLLVHGTFSSTLGSFGALIGDRLLAQYHIVLGYDHRTLAEDPVANAEAILAMLHALDLPETVEIDAVAYSRGGLVYRVLTEQLAPRSPLRATFGKAVFVGCTNGGTLLAEPDNWKALLDVYTNVLVTAARTGLGLAGAGAAEPLVTAALRTMGGFAQMLSQVAITERRVPGLAAMEPDGPLVTQLNSTVRSPERATRYFVVAADFSGAASGSTLGGRAALAMLNRVADRLYGTVANDIVVPTEAMSTFGKAGLAEDIALLPDDEGIYHTVYFTSNTARKRIAQWLAQERTVGSSAPEASPETEMLDGGKAFLPIPTVPPAPISFDRRDSRVRSMPRSGGIRQGDAGIDFGNLISEAISAERSGPRSLAGPRDFEVGHSEALEGTPAPSTRKSRRTQPPTALPEPASSAPQSTTERFIGAEMNPFPVIERPANIYVTVSPDPVVVPDHAAAARLEQPATLERQEMLIIEVVPTLNCEVVGEAREEVGFGIDCEEVLKFRLRGLAAGSAEVLIVARQGSRSVATFTLKPVFVETAPAPLRASASLAPASAIIKGRMVLRIYEFKTAGTGVRLQFNLTGDDPAVAELAPMEINGAFSLEGYTAEVIRQVENAWNLAQNGPGQDIYKSFLRRMRSDAKVRTDALIPDVIRRCLWTNRTAITEIQVISSEPLIPWELMYLSDPNGTTKQDECFFAELALTRWLHDAPLSRHRIRPDRGTCFHVIPRYSRPGEVLKGAEAEAKMLKKKLGLVMTVPPHSNSVVEFLASENAKSCAVLHFACHGRTQQIGTITSELLMQGQVNAQGTEVPDPLTWQDVYANADFGPGGGPLVFVNACQTGQQGSGIAGPAGFASAFLRPASRRGAAAFIGALWSVDDKLAGDFAAAVYDELAAGQTLGTAVAAARKACQNNNDFTWLAYSVYANG